MFSEVHPDAAPRTPPAPLEAPRMPVMEVSDHSRTIVGDRVRRLLQGLERYVAGAYEPTYLDGSRPAASLVRQFHLDETFARKHDLLTADEFERFAALKVQALTMEARTKVADMLKKLDLGWHVGHAAQWAVAEAKAAGCDVAVEEEVIARHAQDMRIADLGWTLTNVRLTPDAQRVLSRALEALREAKKAKAPKSL